ncbi:MAG: 4Fe-4S iron sulfur cluster binding s, NifH/frxC family protein [Bacillales bacterium]|jgi:flagellar biosynthesis protein FlhG|nr:4Fe-4S iron sulfur cluster binding s, NifH/frxC family protein [Bacillales bacterium]
MRDQAESLRRRLNKQHRGSSAKVLSVISGKGGVGKSNFALNFSISLSQKGHSVLLIDLDIGMGNIDILMGFTADRTIVDLFNKQLPIQEVIKSGPNGLSYVAGGTAFNKLFEFDNDRLQIFFNEFEKLLQEYEYIILDMGAGLSDVSFRFLMASNEILVVTTTEPTAITDAYASIKYINSQNNEIPISLLLNRSRNVSEGKQVVTRLSNAVKQFLKKETRLLGIIPDDPEVSRAVSQQIPFIINNPNSRASTSIKEISDRFVVGEDQEWNPQKGSSFVDRLRKLLFER